MDPDLPLKTATVLLGITALGGLLMAALRFAGADRPPTWLAMVHGLLAASGLTLLLFDAFTTGVPRAVWIGALLLVLAALGGVYLNLVFHARLRPVPKNIIVGHALLAIVGFGLIFNTVFLR